MTDIPTDADVQALHDQGALRIFALHVGGKARMLFPGQTERDFERYAPLLPDEVVATSADATARDGGDGWCSEASEEQEKRWLDGFSLAVRNGDAQPGEPGSFLLLIGDTAVLGPIFLPIVSVMAALPV